MEEIQKLSNWDLQTIRKGSKTLPEISEENLVIYKDKINELVEQVNKLTEIINKIKS